MAGSCIHKKLTTKHLDKPKPREAIEINIVIAIGAWHYACVGCYYICTLGHFRVYRPRVCSCNIFNWQVKQLVKVICTSTS